MPQTWTYKSNGKVFKVDINNPEDLARVVEEEFNSSKDPQEKEKAEALLSNPSQNPGLN
jgi:hypothetical protein